MANDNGKKEKASKKDGKEFFGSKQLKDALKKRKAALKAVSKAKPKKKTTKKKMYA